MSTVNVKLVIGVFLLFLSCSKPFWMDEYGEQQITLRLFFVNKTADTLFVSQNSQVPNTLVPTLKISFDTAFFVVSNDTIATDINFNWVTRKEWDDYWKKENPYFSFPANAPSPYFWAIGVTIRHNASIEHLSILPWDTLAIKVYKNTRG